MTGYALVQDHIGSDKCTLEIRSVNGRFLECNIKIPKELIFCEQPLKQRIKEHITRGSVSVFINFEKVATGQNIAADTSAIKQYLATAKWLEQKYAIPNDLSFSHLLAMPEVLNSETTSAAPEMEKDLLSLLDIAMASFTQMRSQEGDFLEKDMRERIARIEVVLHEISDLAPQRVQKWQNKFAERIRELSGEILDPVRISQEASILADRLDISEEIIRFHSHNALFLQTLDEPGKQGKKLNFILQEMGREANTLGTKCQDAYIAKLAITLKEEVESMREQVQNIE